MAIIFILIGVFARIIPHAPNFAPIGAMALFGGTYLGKKTALILPILVMIISDFFLGFDTLIMRLSVYGCFFATVLVGFWLKKHFSFKNLILSSLFSSTLFFAVTNFSVWASGTMYAKNAGGLMEAYILAVPFFRNTIMGDFFYNTIFFGVWKLTKIITQQYRLIPHRT